MSDEERRRIAEGIAVIATDGAEMGLAEADVRRQVLGVLRSLGEDDPTLLREAADAISHQPLPPSDPVDKLEQREHVEKMFGLPTASEQLVAALRAREWLEKWAKDSA